jgi:hypothetical protein
MGLPFVAAMQHLVAFPEHQFCRDDKAPEGPMQSAPGVQYRHVRRSKKKGPPDQTGGPGAMNCTDTPAPIGAAQALASAIW